MIPSIELLLLLRVELESRERWIDDLQSGMWINCVYCGHRYGPGTETPMRKALEDHIAACPKHPLSAALARIETIASYIECTFGRMNLLTANGYLNGDDVAEKIRRGDL